MLYFKKLFYTKPAMITPNKVNETLRKIEIPYLGADLLSAGVIQNVDCKEGLLKLQILLNFLSKTVQGIVKERVLEAFLEFSGLNIAVEVKGKVWSHASSSLPPRPGIKNILAIGSGKGGVGKSTVAVNLALSLAKEGCSVGLLDADIYGPSLPRMLGTHGQKVAVQNNKMIPFESHGIRTLSIGHLIEADTPVIWRGPMLSGALMQLLDETLWGNLDYLIFDLPPGTGDIQLTMAQKIPVSGAVIVTTPQEVAIQDALKSFRMFEKVKVPILGIVENMSTHICTNCQQVETIFGQGGGRKMAKALHVPLLGELPLAKEICEKEDVGEPPSSAHEGIYQALFLEMALSLVAELSKRPRQVQKIASTLVIDNE